MGGKSKAFAAHELNCLLGYCEAIKLPSKPIKNVNRKNKIINAGIAAIAHLTIKTTIEPKGILISITATSEFETLIEGLD